MGLAVDNCDDTDMKPFNLSSVIVAYTHTLVHKNMAVNFCQ